jgi:hypothetical protein
MLLLSSITGINYFGILHLSIYITQVRHSIKHTTNHQGSKESSPVQEFPPGLNDVDGLPQRVQGPDVLPFSQPNAAHAQKP